jgi:hypothetical protein
MLLDEFFSPCVRLLFTLPVEKFARDAIQVMQIFRKTEAMSRPQEMLKERSHQTPLIFKMKTA